MLGFMVHEGAKNNGAADYRQHACAAREERRSVKNRSGHVQRVCLTSCALGLLHDTF